MPKISIITPWRNGVPALLADYAAATAGAEIVTVDNGSDAADAEALAAFTTPRGYYLRNETNAGFAAANNQGYAAATGDVIVFLNSDVAGDATWLQAVARDVQDGALYGPSLGQQLVYGMWLPYLEGWCIAATRATWEKLTPLGGFVNNLTTTTARGRKAQADAGIAPLPMRGPWDAHAYPGPYWEDNDLCLRAMLGRYSLIQTTWPVQHKGGQTTGPLLRWGETFEKNRATFSARAREAWLLNMQAEAQK